MPSSIRFRIVPFFLGSTFVASVALHALAAAPALTKMDVVGDNADRVLPGGSPLRLKFFGTGKCPVEVQVVPLGTDRAAHTQTFEATLDGSQEYATSYSLPSPPSGQKDFTITALPKGPCKGAPQAAIIHVVTKEEHARRRLNLNMPVRTLPLPAGSASAAAAPKPTATGAPTAAPATPAATSSAPPKSTGGGGAPPPPGGGGPSIPGAKAATGSLSTLSVPDGSFAEDEAQKLQLTGTGGCGFDLHITNKGSGGSFDKTWPVNPVNLANNPRVYNGTHFDTLAEGSYHADATGTKGCTGKVQIDFKVTPKNTNATVKGQPTLTLDQKPKSGNAFSRTKDSNVWFKVAVPSGWKDIQFVSCCEVEFDYINQYGGWEVLPTSPFTDPGLNPMANNNSAAFRSVTYFTVPGEGALKWRMRVRGTKFKTAFEWSDWLEFQVDQN